MQTDQKRFENYQEKGWHTNSICRLDRGIVLEDGWIHFEYEDIYTNFCPSHQEVNQLISSIRKAISPFEDYSCIEVITQLRSDVRAAQSLPELCLNEQIEQYKAPDENNNPKYDGDNTSINFFDDQNRPLTFAEDAFAEDAFAEDAFAEDIGERVVRGPRRKGRGKRITDSNGSTISFYEDDYVLPFNVSEQRINGNARLNQSHHEPSMFVTSVTSSIGVILIDASDQVRAEFRLPNKKEDFSPEHYWVESQIATIQYQAEYCIYKFLCALYKSRSLPFNENELYYAMSDPENERRFPKTSNNLEDTAEILGWDKEMTDMTAEEWMNNQLP